MNRPDIDPYHPEDLSHFKSPAGPITGFRINYAYTIKVWVTTVLLGTTLYFAFKSWTEVFATDHFSARGDSSIFYYLLSIGMSLILSLPGLLLFTLGYNFITDYLFSTTKIKVALSIIGQALCWLSFLIGFGISNTTGLQTNMEIILPYAVAQLFSSFVYKLSNRIY